MVKLAIKTGAKMGISLIEGDLVDALGNCLLESVMGNIEGRDIFDRKIEETVTSLRKNIAEEGEKVIGSSPYRIEDFNDEDWSRGWDQLKHSGVWDVDYFGDLMIIALAHYIGKNILLINTDPESAPITVVLGDRFGKPLNSEYPVILAYSGTHYESLIPISDGDETMARQIIQKYIKGEDLFSNNNDTSSNTIQTRKIDIQKSDFSTEVWNENNLNSNTIFKSRQSSPSLSSLDDNSPVQPSINNNNDSMGLNNWTRFHPTKSGNYSNSLQWNTSQNSISIPIKIIGNES